MPRQPKATIEDQSDGVTIWRIEWPSSPAKWGQTYFAVCAEYGAIRLQTGAKRQWASANVSARLMPAVKDAIARASRGKK